MKNTIVVLALFVLSATSYGQKRADYEGAIKKFQGFYNTGKADRIADMFSDVWTKPAKNGKTSAFKKSDMWNAEENDRMIKKYGKMLSYKYLAMDRDEKGLALFKVVFSKSTHMMSCVLDKKNKFETFRFDTSSPYYDSLLAKNK